MKIINRPITSVQEQRQEQHHLDEIKPYRPISNKKQWSKSQLLTKEIITMMADVGEKKYKAWHDFLPIEKKEELVALLEQAASLSAQHYQREETVNWHRTATFHSFARLPPELRLQIWEYHLAPYVKPRVHAIAERNCRWVSNQPSSVLLQICQESRNLFLFQTMTSFTFGTYLNFDIDIICPQFANNPEERLPKFLESEGISKVKRMALDCQLLSEHHWISEGPEILPWVQLKHRMPALEETPFVLGDCRSLDQTWIDTDIEYKKLSSKQRRTCPGYKFVYGYSHALDVFLSGRDIFLRHLPVTIDPKTTYFPNKLHTVPRRLTPEV